MRLTAAIISAIVLTGCSDDPTEVIDPGPTGNPSLAISEPASGECVSVGEDADVRVPLLVSVSEVLLRPPGGCVDIVQCGRLALYAGGILNNETSARAVDLLVFKLGDPYHDGSVHAGTGQPDLLSVRVDLISDATGEVMLDHEGEPLTDSVDLVTVVSCDAITDGS